jgi:hypothetical protein
MSLCEFLHQYEFMLFDQLIWHAISAKRSPILTGLGAFVRFDIVKV